MIASFSLQKIGCKLPERVAQINTPGTDAILDLRCSSWERLPRAVILG
jgi:hypothetical protein